MSFASNFAIDKAGKAQKGCIKLVHASPHEMAIQVIAGEKDS